MVSKLDGSLYQTSEQAVRLFLCSSAIRINNIKAVPIVRNNNTIQVGVYNISKMQNIYKRSTRTNGLHKHNIFVVFPGAVNQL